MNEKVLSDYQASIKHYGSAEYDENPSENDVIREEEEGLNNSPSQQERSLIERYKRLDLLMKRKKMMS